MKNIGRMSLLFSVLFSLNCSPMLKSPTPAVQKVEKDTVFADCPLDFKKISFCGQLAPIQKPLKVGSENLFKLALWQKDTANFTGPYSDPGLSINVWLWMVMSTGSHGSLPVYVAQDIDSMGTAIPGVYRVTKVYFSMSCRNESEWWEIHIEVKNSDGTVVDEVVQKIVI